MNFFGFVRQHDIMTIGRLPIVSTDPETGVVAIVASARTRRMMNRAVDLYKWGMVDTAARFGAHGDCGSLSLNDISVFKMLISPAKSPAGNGMIRSCPLGGLPLVALNTSVEPGGINIRSAMKPTIRFIAKRRANTIKTFRPLICSSILRT